MSFIYPKFAKKHKYFQYTTNGKEYVYKIFAVNVLSSAEVTILPNKNVSKDVRKKYINSLRNTSIYKYDIDVNSSDKIITLATCTRMFGMWGAYYDLAVTGRLVKDGEKYTDYSLKKTKKYKEIDNVLKGDDEDD